MSKQLRLYYVILAALVCKWLLWSSGISAEIGIVEPITLDKKVEKEVNAINNNGNKAETGRAEPDKKIAEKEENNKENTNGNNKNNNNNDKKDKKEKPKKELLTYVGGDSEFRFWTKLRLPDFTYGKNLRLLNDDNPTDRIIFFRHTLDFNFEYRYGKASREYEVVFGKLTIRNKGIWGDPESIAFTTLSTIKETDAVFGEHRHAIPRHILWIRELWLQFSLTDLFCLPFCNAHTLTLGAFPFELGRGIALGSSFAVDPSDLGYISESAVDQYAFGGKLSGDLIKDVLTYDLYGGILENKADTFDNVNLKIRGQEFGHRNDQARGFGIIEYVVAARLRWMPKVAPWAKVRLEPYILFSHDPEQRIEFLADASSDLGTAGLAGEFEVGNFECGFDTAFNFGRQNVKGWDRNVIQRENRNGTVVVVNSRVRQAPPGQDPDPAKSPLALKVGANQSFIDTSPRAASENGQIIGTNSLGTLINDLNRFTDPYTNSYQGYMFVYDMSYYFCKPDFKVSAALGYASGDADPNRDEEFPGDSEIDGEYEGFIGLEETYSGTRVRSAFLLSGSAKIPRPLVFPDEEVFDPFTVTTVNRFTNIIFVGAGFTWQPSWSYRKWSFNPNVLAYWQDFPPHFFNATLQQNMQQFARPFLGTEINIFIEAQFLEDLKFYLVSSLFVPGGLYKDITGRPLNKTQQAFLDNLDTTGIINDRVPFIGHDNAIYFNAGFEYKF
jgi:hypothetical protein